MITPTQLLRLLTLTNGFYLTKPQMETTTSKVRDHTQITETDKDIPVSVYQCVHAYEPFKETH